MIATGTRLPAIALASTRGGAVDLSKLGGRAVVFVYPYTGRPGVPDPPGWDDIPGAHGSTPQAQGFRDLAAEFRQGGWDVFGLSGQSTAWQGEASARLGLPFALLSDEGFGFADAMGLARFWAGDRQFLARVTLLIQNGILADTFQPALDPAGHARALLDHIQARSST